MEFLFADVIERFRSGKKMDEMEFDKLLFHETERVKKKYDILYQSGKAVEMDNNMADRCFEADRELFASIGIYCLDTQPVARFTLEEMDRAMQIAPDEVLCGSRIRRLRA